MPQAPRRTMAQPVAAILVSVLALAGLTGCARASQGPTPTISTTSGPVIGFESGQALEWRGIPYAAPPKRWQHATAPTPWATPKVVDKFSASCPQNCNLPPATCPPTTSEDCLFLNIFSPHGSLGRGEPVMVFFHGGRYEQGGAGVNLYEGYSLANRTSNVIVTVNYRLGVLGFMSLSDTPATGNYGVLDQRLALQWVKANIANFGGNPDHVTIFGQSAGATSTEFHMVSKGSFGLYTNVIAESSPLGLPLLTPEVADKHYHVFSKDAGCGEGSDAFECLTKLPVEQILTAQKTAEHKIYVTAPLTMFFPWVPLIDGKELTGQPIDLFASGDFNAVPLMIGNVYEEARVFILEVATKPVTRFECEAVLDLVFTTRVSKIKEQYPIPHDVGDCRDALMPLASAFTIVCSSRFVANLVAERAPVYRYMFNHSYLEHGGWGPNYAFCEDHVCHGEELPFVFGSGPASGFNLTAKETELSQLMMSYWGNFARNGNPNTGTALPHWQPADNKTDVVMAFSLDSQPLSGYRAEECAFWDKFGYDFLK